MRPLTKQQKAALRYFYMPPSAVGNYLITFLPLVIGWSIGTIFFSFIGALAMALSAILLCVLIRNLVRKGRLRKAVFVYQNGAEGTLIFNSIQDNWSTTVNGWPQQIITSYYNGSPIQTKTFNPTYVKIFLIKSQKAYAHIKYPKIVVPAGLFNAIPEPINKKTDWIFKIIVAGVAAIYIFLAAFQYFTEGSDLKAQSDALLYYSQNKPVLATVASDGTTYKNDHIYAACLSLNTGRQIWRTKLKAADNNGKYYGDGQLLGMSEKYLFFYHNEIFVLDKSTGDIVAQNKDFHNLNGKLSTETTSNGLRNDHFIYNDSMQALIARGTDGLFYTIDGNSLEAATLKITDPERLFKNKVSRDRNYNDQIAAMYDNGQTCIALLDDQDKALLDTTHHYGISDRPNSQSIRRQVSVAKTVNKGNRWESSDSTVYILGGLLVDIARKVAWPVNGRDPASYISLFIRFNHVNQPILSHHGDLVVMHKASTESNAPILLSGVSSTGKHLWTQNTGITGELPLYVMDYQSDQIYVLSEENQKYKSWQLNKINKINLITGQSKQYSIKF